MVRSGCEVRLANFSYPILQANISYIILARSRLQTPALRAACRCCRCPLFILSVCLAGRGRSAKAASTTNAGQNKTAGRSATCELCNSYAAVCSSCAHVYHTAALRHVQVKKPCAAMRQSRRCSGRRTCLQESAQRTGCSVCPVIVLDAGLQLSADDVS